MHRTTQLLAAISLFAALPAAAADRLTVYTYESFTADWGPGPQVKTAFEAICSCELVFVPVADGVALLNRVKLEGAGGQADIVLGLDTNLTADAAASGLFAEHGIATAGLAVPNGWNDSLFLPYDYGYFAVMYDSEAITTPPSSLKELFEGDAAQKIVIQDPRTSTPGLGLVLWARKVFGDGAGEAWKKFSSRVLTVTPGWSEAYGLFTSGEAPMVLSYTTSEAYHRIAEGSERYKAAAFSEGHYMQVEVAGMTLTGAGNPLAAQFLSFMISPAFQDIIPQTNWMLPAAATSKPLDAVFSAIPKPEPALIFSSEEVTASRQQWVAEWLDAMSLAR
ncbi:MAG: thiamine ABC transporter substrate binding subunit [Rhizobiaceae bacterium]